MKIRPDWTAVAFACPVAVAFFARSSAAVFSFIIVAGEAYEERLGGDESGRSGRRRRGQGENGDILFKNPHRAPL